jgi:uncharacterized membrane protein YhaH (DUF805 family)
VGDQAFPTASVDLKVKSAQAAQQAGDYLQERGFDLADYSRATIFAPDSAAAVYLQKTLGMDEANRRIREERLPVWFWRTRWFRSQQKEEYLAWVSPAGELLGFEQALEEDRPGTHLTEEEAIARAESFLRDVAKVPLDDYESVHSSSKKEKERTDHTFVWKKKDFELEEGELRLRVGVWGDTVGAYRHFFKVPEKFERDFKAVQGQGQLLAILSIVFSVILFGLALMVFVQRYKADDVRWRFALFFALLILVLGIGAQANALPLAQVNYPTELSYGVWIAMAILAVVLVTLIYGVFILLTGAAGEALTREMRVESVRPLHDLIAGRLLTPQFAAAAGRGYLAAFAMVGYFATFYFLGRRFFGVWVQAESPYNNLLSTSFPFLFPLFVSLTAAISEEFTYRFFAIPFLRKYVKNVFLALLIPAVIWGFGHSTYAVFPVYVRGIEVTLIGLLFGWLYLRYDILTCIMAHYAVDAIFLGWPLLQSENTYFFISGLVVALLGLLPLFPALVVWIRRPPAATG